MRCSSNSMRIFGMIEEMRAVDVAGVEPMAHAQNVVSRLRETPYRDRPARAVPVGRASRRERSVSRSQSHRMTQSERPTNGGVSHTDRLLAHVSSSVASPPLRYRHARRDAQNSFRRTRRAQAVQRGGNRAFLGRIKALNSRYNCFISVDEERSSHRRRKRMRLALPVAQSPLPVSRSRRRTFFARKGG